MAARRTLFRFAAPAALLLAGACTTPFRADVTRFQLMPPPQGQTFAVQAADARDQGGIEFQMYSNLVATRLAQQGYTPVPEGQPASLIVSLDYGIDNGHEKVYSTPGFGGWGWGGPGFGYGGIGYGGFRGRGAFYGGLGYGGYGGFGGGFGGWGGGFGGWGGDYVDSYTYFVSHLDMRIRRATDSRVVFEGRARARSTDPSLQRLVPNLVDAMFTGFPGRSGEDVLITLPPADRARGGATVRPAMPTRAAPINNGV